MKILIVLHHRFELWIAPPWFTGRLRHEFPSIEITQLSDYQGIEEQIRDAEVVVTWSLRPEQLRAAAKLRWIHSTAAAVHALMSPELVQSDVVVTNAREVHGPVVAEHAIALMFAMAKQIPMAVRAQNQRLWAQGGISRATVPARELRDSTLGLIGVGSIGRAVARQAAALGMRVLALREHPENGSAEGVAELFGPADLDHLLRVSDYVIVAAPLTEETSSMIDSTRFAHMKSSACLINVSRGALIDENALIQALRQKKIGAAALDVFENEPLPAESPLWDMENVLITPHTAGVTDKLWERQYTLFSENLRRFLAGQPLRDVVDKQKGY